MPPVFIAPAAWQTHWLSHPAYTVWAGVAQPLAGRPNWPDQAALDGLFKGGFGEGGGTTFVEINKVKKIFDNSYTFNLPSNGIEDKK